MEITQKAKQAKVKFSSGIEENFDPYEKLQVEIKKLHIETTPSKFFSCIIVTRNGIWFKTSFLTQDCGWTDTQIDELLDPKKPAPGQLPKTQWFMFEKLLSFSW